MIQKEVERNRGSPSKRTRFFLRGQPVKRTKIERFRAEHPNLKPRRSGKYCMSVTLVHANTVLATPSSIAYTTEASESVSQEVSSDYGPLLAGPLSPSSSMIGGTAPSQTSSEIARKLWLDCELLERHPGGFICDVEPKSPEGSKVEGFSVDNPPVVHSPAQAPKKSRTITGRPSLRHQFETSSNDTSTPGSHCPALVHFDWWVKYGQWCTKSSDKVIEDALAHYFQGLVIPYNTFEAAMDHEEKLHQHHVMAVEAGWLEEHGGIRQIQSPSEADLFMRRPLDLESMSSESMLINKSVATSILLNRKLWHSSKQVSASSSYPVDVRWCVSEFMKEKLTALTEAQMVSDWLECIIFLFDDCRILAFSGRKKAFEGFLSLTAVLLSSLLLPATDVQGIRQVSPLDHIRAAYGQDAKLNSITQEPHSAELLGCNRLMRTLMDWFDPLGTGSDDGVVEDTVQELLRCFQEISRDWDTSRNEIDVNKLALIAFKHVTVLRYGQVYPLNIEGFFAIDQHNNGLSVSDEAVIVMGYEELAWASAWGVVCFYGPKLEATVPGWSAEFRVLEPDELEEVSEILSVRWSQLEATIGFTNTNDYRGSS